MNPDNDTTLEPCSTLSKATSPDNNSYCALPYLRLPLLPSILYWTTPFLQRCNCIDNNDSVSGHLLLILYLEVGVRLSRSSSQLKAHKPELPRIPLILILLLMLLYILVHPIPYELDSRSYWSSDLIPSFQLKSHWHWFDSNSVNNIVVGWKQQYIMQGSGDGTNPLTPLLLVSIVSIEEKPYQLYILLDYSFIACIIVLIEKPTIDSKTTLTILM